MDQLIESIGNRRIVCIGESNHGVSEYTSWKAALLEELTQQHGFDVVIFEAPIAECYEAHLQHRNSRADRFVRHALYGIWHTVEMASLYRGLCNVVAEHPIRIIGCDFRVRRTREKSALARIAEELPGQNSASIIHADKTLAKWNRHGYIRPDDLEHLDLNTVDDIRNIYQDLLYCLASTSIEDHDSFERYAVASRALDNRLKLLEVIRDEQAYYRGREQAMAANVEWIARSLWPDARCVVLSHNLHVRRHQSDLDGEPSCGEILNRCMLTDCYSIGQYMYGGTAAWNRDSIFRIATPPVNSLEFRLHRPGSTNFFDCHTISDSNHWGRNSCESLAFGVELERIIPCDQYDGIVVFDEVHPPSFLGRLHD